MYQSKPDIPLELATIFLVMVQRRLPRMQCSNEGRVLRRGVWLVVALLTGRMECECECDASWDWCQRLANAAAIGNAKAIVDQTTKLKAKVNGAAQAAILGAAA